MEKCSNCSVRPKHQGDFCLECSKAKRRIWEKLGIYGSSIFMIVGSMMFLFATNIHSYFTCGASVCPSQSIKDAEGFFQAVGDGISTLVVIVGMMAIGAVLFIYGVVGLTVSLIVIYRQRKLPLNSSESNIP